MIRFTGIRRLAGYPAVPLGLLLNGSFYYFVLMHLAGVSPFPLATGIFYAFLCAWAVMAVLVHRKEVAIKFHLVDAFFILLMITIALSAAVHDFVGAEKYLRFVPFFVLVPYTCARMLSEKQVSIFIQVSAWCGGLALLIIGARLILVPQDYGDRPLLFGYSHLGVLSSMLLGSLTVLIVAYIVRPAAQGSRSMLEKIGLAILPLAIATMMYLGGRGSIAAMVATSAAVLLSAIFFGARKKLLLLLGVYLLVCLVLVFAFLPKNQSEFFARAALDMHSGGQHDHVKHADEIKNICDKIQWLEESGHSIEIRKLLYGQALSMAISAPIFGVGAGEFGERLCRNGVYFPHSTFLQALAELGLWGAGLLLGMTWLAGGGLVRIVFNKEGRAERRATAWLLLALGCFYLITDQIYGNYFMSIPFYLLVGASIALAANQPPQRQQRHAV
jgi:hypothetical protein